MERKRRLHIEKEGKDKNRNEKWGKTSDVSKEKVLEAVSKKNENMRGWPRPRDKILFSPRLREVYELTFLRHLRGRWAWAGTRRWRHCNERNKFLFLIKVSSLVVGA